MVRVEGLRKSYGTVEAVRGVSLDVLRGQVVVVIGPSGCGKSTFLRCLNRMNDTILDCRVTGELTLDTHPILGRTVDPVEVRKRVGMVFQKSNPFLLAYI